MQLAWKAGLSDVVVGDKHACFFFFFYLLEETSWWSLCYIFR